MGVYRLTRGPKDEDEREDDVFLEYLEIERQALIMRLRAIERVLIHAGKLRRESLPTRSK